MFQLLKSVTFSTTIPGFDYIGTPALFLSMIYLEHTEPESSYGFSKLFLKIPRHFLVLMKLIRTSLLKQFQRKYSNPISAAQIQAIFS